MHLIEFSEGTEETSFSFPHPVLLICQSLSSPEQAVVIFLLEGVSVDMAITALYEKFFLLL